MTTTASSPADLVRRLRDTKLAIEQSDLRTKQLRADRAELERSVIDTLTDLEMERITVDGRSYKPTLSTKVNPVGGAANEHLIAALEGLGFESVAQRVVSTQKLGKAVRELLDDAVEQSGRPRPTEPEDLAALLPEQLRPHVALAVLTELSDRATS